MNLPPVTISQLADRLIRNRVSFAFYRQPWTDDPILVLQEQSGTQTVDNIAGLNGKQGFVLVPFRQTPHHPIALIQPDKVARGWDAVCEALDEFAGRHKLLLEETDKPARRDPDTGQTPAETEAEEADYRKAFGRFIAPLKENTFQKLVLSRVIRMRLPDEFSPLEAFVHACNSYPRMMVSFCHTPATGTWLGSTPEIILSGHDTQWHTVSLAGTMPMEGDTMPDKWSWKNLREQEIVSEYIRRTIRQFGSKMTEKGPYTARAGHLVHLKTDFSFSLKDTAHLGDVLHELHPTPAVCGLPKQEAYEFIAANEGYDRKYYAGIIGWLDPQGDTSLYVNLRCMEIKESSATLYAGGGILPSSTIESEWEETRQKLNTMLNIL